MIWIYGIILLASGVFADDGNVVQVSATQQFLEQRCYKHAKDGDVYDTLVGLSVDFYKYAEFTSSFFPNHMDHFCENEVLILKRKLRDVNKQMLKCMDDEERFLPQFIQDSFHAFLDFLCVNHGSNVKTFFSTHGKECRSALSRQNATEEVGSCFSKYFASVNDQGHMTKITMCSDIGLVNGCFTTVLNKYCPDFAAFQELNKRFFTYINKPCSACIFGINNIVTFSCVLIALLYKKLF